MECRNKNNVYELITDLILFRPGRESDSEAEDIEHAEKLRQVKAVLEEVHIIVLSEIMHFFFYFQFHCCVFIDFYFHLV